MTARTRRRDSAATGASSGDDDLNDLRVALGYDKMSLMGFSYGTHLALATIRRHEPHIDNVVLAGVENLDETHKLPLNMDVQFRKLSRIVADDPVIGADVPDLVSLYKRVIEKLNREPMEVELRGGDNPRPVAVGAWGLNFILRFDIGDASDLPVFPRLLYSIDRGDPSVLTWFVRRRAPIFFGRQPDAHVDGRRFRGITGALGDDSRTGATQHVWRRDGHAVAARPIPPAASWISAPSIARRS